jgi:lambda repressor-like predicted transcriptional regulator
MAKHRKEFWRKEVAALAASGLSVEKFSERKSYSPTSLYSWRRKLSRPQPFTQAVIKPALSAPVEVPASLPEPEWVARFVRELVRRRV